MIGVLDYGRQKDQRTSSDSGYAMCYFGYNGSKYPKAGYEGRGFKEGDVVEVQVDRMAKLVQYFVNDVLQATQANKMLGEPTSVFMPFVEMFRTDDEVEWLIDDL